MLRWWHDDNVMALKMLKMLENRRVKVMVSISKEIHKETDYH